METGGKLLHFVAGGRRFAVPVAAIAEIRETGDTTQVPGAPDAIAGLIDMRGRIVTLMDLAAIFDLAPHPSGSRLAVQLAEPLEHLALLVPARVQDLRTEEGAGSSGREEAQAGSLSPDGSGAGPLPLGREMVLADGAPAFLLDLRALVAHCAQRVRDRFRIAV